MGCEECVVFVPKWMVMAQASDKLPPEVESATPTTTLHHLLAPALNIACVLNHTLLLLPACDSPSNKIDRPLHPRRICDLT